MRSIGSLESSQHAKRLAAFLLTEGIKSQMINEDSEWEVWINDEDLLDKSREILAEFQSNPDHERYRAALTQAEAMEREQEKKRREYQKNLKVGTPTNQKKFPFTITLIVICGIVAVITGFGGPAQIRSAPMQALVYNSLKPDASKKLFESLGEDRHSPNADFFEDARVRHASIFSGQFWRLFTPMFIHFTPFHLLMNMIWLFQLGRQIEHRYGTVFFAVLVLFIAMVSNFAQGAVPEGIGGSVPQIIDSRGLLMTMFGGMSGVVFGLLGFIWIKSSVDPESRMYLSPSTIVFMLIFLFFCMTPMAEGTFLSNVANWAHGVGLLSGLVAGYVMTLFRK